MSPAAPTVVDTTAAELESILESAAAASRSWAVLDGAARAGSLRAVAAALTAATEELVEIAHAETHLPFPRLRGELVRTTFQLGLFADAVEAGDYLGAVVDHADPAWPMGAPRPDLRRMLVPVGPVVVFAGSNFPFAFSVAGGDTASALAAGCTVIVKAHPGHLNLSAATAAVVTGALADSGAPSGTFALVVGDEAGRVALTDERVQAGAFTGSLRAGRLLFDLAAAREVPIPFFAEMGSVNPVLVTGSAAQDRAAQIAAAFVGSFTLGVGQFCTKPGLLVVPVGSALLAELRSAELPSAAPMLNDRISAGFAAGLQTLAGHEATSVLRRTDAVDGLGAPTLLVTSAAQVLADPGPLTAEVFGPAALVVTYTDDQELLAVTEALEGQLTASIFADPSDAVVPELMVALAQRSGRLLWNQWPTGVSVTHAQQHGGPYPATTAPATTSVGTAAAERFLRPVSFQGFPDELLPAAVQEGNPLSLQRRVDGVVGTS